MNWTRPLPLFRAAAAVAFLLAVAACGSNKTATSSAASTADADPFSHAGRWIVDGQGRVVLFHGLNEVPKLQPGYVSVFGFGDADAAWIAANGFNAVRLGIFLADLEPQPGVIDHHYLSEIVSTVHLLDRYGIATLVDFHQDAYGPAFLDSSMNADGFPAWATLSDELPNPSGPAWQQYLGNLALERAWDNFWSDAATPAGPIQEVYAAAVATVARRLVSDHEILGFDVFNEPWPGTPYGSCYSSQGCGALEARDLVPFYHRVLSALRAVDRSHLAFVEPFLTFDNTYPSFLPALGDPRTVFAFHTYCAEAGGGTGVVHASAAIETTCAPEEALNLANAQAAQRGNGMGLVNTEWGDSDDPVMLRRVVAEMDTAQVGWMEWGYDDCCFEPENHLGLKLDRFRPPVAANIDQSMLTALQEPYPQVVAGTPTTWEYDPAAGIFHLRYSTLRASGGRFAAGSLTSVFVPRSDFPHGFTVTLRGGEVASSGCGPHLIIRSVAGTGAVDLSLHAATRCGA